MQENLKNLTSFEQKLLQKYEVWEILENYWLDLEKLAENNQIKESEKITKWQSFLEQVFDQSNLKAQFENQILQKNYSQTSQNLKNPEIQKTFDQKSKSEIQENYRQESWTNKPKPNLFDNNYWTKTVLPQIEHPQFTRPKIWTINLEKLNSELNLGNLEKTNSIENDEKNLQKSIESAESENAQNSGNQNEIQSEITNSENQTLEFKVPEVLLAGNHLEIAKWRQNGWKSGN